jgi:hypothetical protein
VRSELGVGSTFYVTVPSRLPSSTPPPVPASIAERSR